jgi:branched-chain amino acid transport system ATP-binding protein
MLEVKDLHVGYGATNVIEGLSLEVAQGEFFGLLGANNAGKSTLINALSGIVRARRGRVLFEGADVTALPPEDLVELGIVQVPEGRLVFPQMSVQDNLLMGGVSRRARRERARRIDEVMQLFPRLAERRTQPAGTLSGGEQQMLAIGRGLVANPRLLMLDEPSLGLSPLIVQFIFKALDELHRGGLTILLVEQNLNLTIAHASRCAVLERGQLVLEGSGAELRHDPRTRKAYLGL